MTDAQTIERGRRGWLTAAAIKTGQAETVAWLGGPGTTVSVTISHDPTADDGFIWLVTRTSRHEDKGPRRVVATITQTSHHLLEEARAAFLRASHR